MPGNALIMEFISHRSRIQKAQNFQSRGRFSVWGEMHFLLLCWYLVSVPSNSRRCGKYKQGLRRLLIRDTVPVTKVEQL